MFSTRQSFSQAPAYLAAGAALLAVAIGVLNVYLTSRFTGKREQWQWQRDLLLREVVAVLEECYSWMNAITYARRSEEGMQTLTSERTKHREQLIRLRFQLTATAPKALTTKFVAFMARLDELTDAIDDETDPFRERVMAVSDAREQFTDAARASLRIEE